MKKRSNGLYQKQITVTENGIKKQKCFYGKTIAEVNRKILAYQSQEKQIEKDKYLLSAVVDDWYENHKKEITYNTVIFYKKSVEDIKEKFANLYLDEIKPKDILAYIFELSKKGFARQTINARYLVLCQTFDYAIFNELAEINPARIVTLPKNLKSTPRETLTKAEIDTINKSGNLYANVLLYTGTRRNEALALRWEDIDFVEDFISIKKSVLWVRGEKATAEKTKSKASVAEIPLLQPLKEMLQPIKKKKGYLFTNSDGELISEKQFRSLWSKFKKETGLTCTPHQFKHAFVSMAWASGVDVKTAQKLARHAKVETTLNIYTHLDKAMTSEAKDKINAHLLK